MNTYINVIFSFTHFNTFTNLFKVLLILGNFGVQSRLSGAALGGKMPGGFFLFILFFGQCAATVFCYHLVVICVYGWVCFL